MQTTDTLHTPTKYAQKQSFSMKSITTTKEEYLNILNESLELVPSVPAISEADMILAEGEQWKSDVE